MTDNKPIEFSMTIDENVWITCARIGGYSISILEQSIVPWPANKSLKITMEVEND